MSYELRRRSISHMVDRLSLSLSVLLFASCRLPSHRFCLRHHAMQSVGANMTDCILVGTLTVGVSLYYAQQNEFRGTAALLRGTLVEDFNQVTYRYFLGPSNHSARNNLATLELSKLIMFHSVARLFLTLCFRPVIFLPCSQRTYSI